MSTSTSSDVKKLLELAERMGIPTAEAMNQVRELSAEPDVSDRYAASESRARRPAS